MSAQRRAGEWGSGLRGAVRPSEAPGAPTRGDGREGVEPEIFRVLVVDDEDPVRRSIEGILSLDFETVSCASGAEALLRFEEGSFHVVCSDYMMPGMDGATLLAEISRRSAVTCCLLMTARIDVESISRDFPMVFKPFDPAQFIHTVGHLARIAGMKRSTRALSNAMSGTAGWQPPRRGAR